MPRTGIPGGRTGHDGPPSCLQMVITRGPGVSSAVPAPARLLVVVAAVALGRPRHPRPGQARSGASPPIRRLGLSAGARPPRRPPGGVGLAGMAWGMRRGVPGFKHGAFRAGWPSCPKLARPAPAHAPRPARPECPFPGASHRGPSLAPAGPFTLRFGKGRIFILFRRLRAGEFCAAFFLQVFSGGLAPVRPGEGARGPGFMDRHSSTFPRIPEQCPGRQKVRLRCRRDSPGRGADPPPGERRPPTRERCHA